MVIDTSESWNPVQMLEFADAQVQESIRNAELLESEHHPSEPYTYPEEDFQRQLSLQSRLRRLWLPIKAPSDFANLFEIAKATRVSENEILDLNQLPIGTKIFLRIAGHRTSGYCIQLVETQNPKVPRLIRLSNLGKGYYYIAPTQSIFSIDPVDNIAYPNHLKVGSDVSLPLFPDSFTPGKVQVGWGGTIQTLVIKPPLQTQSP
ncbi:hypothetical protein HYW55_02365 [Candidatus Gottesmanbacteria bacterium]|nr:hypothetical protein [Candidatus Gottesmanbacteria bacterium]